MNTNQIHIEPLKEDFCQPGKGLPDQSEISRRSFVKMLGSGILISMVADVSSVKPSSAGAQTNSVVISERLHIGTDGLITVMTGKVEFGQGSRTELTQVAAEELRVPIKDIRLVMGDTDLVPDDGATGSSTTTPGMVPKIRKACAAARTLLVSVAAEKWHINGSSLTVSNGTIINTHSSETITYSELAKTEDFHEVLTRGTDTGVSVTPVKDWTIMGKSALRMNGSNIVRGVHCYPSDIVRPDMHYGKVLYPPSFGASLVSIDLKPAETMEGIIVVRDGDFVGVTAPTSHMAEKVLNAISKTAMWKTQPQPSSKELFTHLKEHVSESGDPNKQYVQKAGSVKDKLTNAEKVLQGHYEISHIQHATLETRAAVAEWNDGKVTIWTGTASPFPVRNEIAKLLGIPADSVRIIVPDIGGHFCGKHSGEAAIQAARLARAAKRPVSVRWSREEEFTWAYFRSAGLIEIQAGIDASGTITAWEFTNYNSGTSAIATPYDIPNISVQFKRCQSPLREGSYRAVAAPANVFARESFMDELAHAADADPLRFRLKHINDERLKNVLETAANQFNWDRRKNMPMKNLGIGLACAIEKGSYTAACVEVEIDRTTGAIRILEVYQAFDCGAIINPVNLRAQVEGCIVMGLGGALWEEIKFENGKILNASFHKYRVPRFKDLPEIKTILIDRPDLPSAGAGETPMIAIAPAIGNAVYAAAGIRIRSMPMRGDILKQG